MKVLAKRAKEMDSPVKPAGATQEQRIYLRATPIR